MQELRHRSKLFPACGIAIIFLGCVLNFLASGSQTRHVVEAIAALPSQPDVVEAIQVNPSPEAVSAIMSRVTAVILEADSRLARHQVVAYALVLLGMILLAHSFLSNPSAYHVPIAQAASGLRPGSRLPYLLTLVGAAIFVAVPIALLGDGLRQSIAASLRDDPTVQRLAPSGADNTALLDAVTTAAWGSSMVRVGIGIGAATILGLPLILCGAALFQRQAVLRSGCDE